MTTNNNKMMKSIMKDVNENKKADTVRERYCDVPMARKKGYLPCEKNCQQCNACIEVMQSGEKRHVIIKGSK